MRLMQLMVATALIALSLAIGGGAALAQTTPTQTFTLQPGGRATVTYEAYCTDFGQKFPTTLQAPNAVAEDNVRGALAYIQQNNLSADENQALEAQYAIWQLRGAAGSPAGGDTAKAVVAAASTAPTNPQGTSVLDAVQSGQVRLTLGAWSPIGQPVAIGSATDNFYGRGELTLENTSQQALTLYMPVGTLFPPATAGEQTMAAYATNVQVTNPQPTPQPTTAAAGGQAGQQPQTLPNTAEGDTGVSWLLFGGALALIAIGYSFRLGLRRR
jgi:hypothetical protein